MPFVMWRGACSPNTEGRKVARSLLELKNSPAESTQDCSGNWALELGYTTRSSTAPIPKMWTILVSCRGTRSQQRVWFWIGKASRSFGSGHHDLARGRERKLKIKTIMVLLDPYQQHRAAGSKLVGGP